MDGFIVYGHDIGAYAFREPPPKSAYPPIHQALVPDMSGRSHPGVRRCEECGELLAKWEEPLGDLVLKKKRFDIGATYDGVDLVSSRFKAVYEENRLIGLDFRPLPKVPAFFAVLPTRVVAYDAERTKTQFIKPCSRCGRFESVTGATPVFLRPGTNLQDHEFVRTDLEFGSGDEKSPLVICGEVAAADLSRARLKGLDLEPLGSSHRK
jgi:hypothetical protein